MEQFEPIDIDFLINKNEVKADAAAVKKSIQGIADEGESVAKKVDAQLSGLFKGTNEQLTKEQQLIVARKKHYEELRASIRKNSTAQNKTLFSEQTGIVDAKNNIGLVADEVSRLGAATDKTAKKQDKSKSSTKGLISGLLGWGAALTFGLELLRNYAPEIKNYIAGMLGLGRAAEEAKLAQDVFNKALDSSSYKKGIANIIELRNVLDLAKEGTIDKTVALDKYNKIIGDTAGKATTLKDVEQGLIDNADAYIEMTFKKAAANLALEEAAQKAVDAEKRRENLELSDFTLGEQLSFGSTGAPAGLGLVGALFGSDIDIAAAQQKANKAAAVISKEGESLQKIYERMIAEAEAAAKKLKTSVFGDGAANAKKIFDQRKKLLEQIANLDKEYARKALTRDAEEQQALKDKFDKIRKLVLEFNADPKNSKAIIGIDALNEIESKASADLIYKQETRSLKEELAVQKTLFKDFEDYKKSFGTTQAKARYAEQLGDFETYADTLKQKVKDNEEAFTAVANGTATGAQVDRVQLISKELTAATKKQLTAFAEQLVALRSYEEERTQLVETYQEKRQQLIEKGATSAVAVLDQQHKDELASLDDAHIKKTDAYKALFEGVGQLTRDTGKKLIADAKALLETQTLSAETRNKILKLIADTEREIENLSADDIFVIANALGNLGDALQGFDNPALNSIGGLLSGLAGGVDDFLTAIDENASDGAKIGAAINGIVKLVTVIAQASKQRKEAEEAYYRSLIGLQQDYNIGLQEQIRLQSILNESVFIKDYEGRITDALAAVRNANEGYQDALKDLEKATVITGQRNAADFGNIGTGAASGATVGAVVGSVVPVIGTVIGAAVGAVLGGLAGLFGGKTKKNEYTAILQEYPELLQKSSEGVITLNKELAQSLINNDLLNDKSKQILENILEWGEALEESREQIKEVIQDLSGGLGADLRDNLVDAFTQGEDAALRMGETVDDVLENIVSNLVFNRIFSDAFTKLEDDMAKSFDIGGDGSWVDDMSRFFNEAQGLTDDFNQALTDAQREASDFGFDIFNPDSGDDEPGLAGAIRRELTEETGSELTGLFRGQYDISKRHFELAEKHILIAQKHYDGTLTIMAHSALIERNTRQTMEQLVYVNGKLEDIKTNTKPQQGSRDLGLGG